VHLFEINAEAEGHLEGGSNFHMPYPCFALGAPAVCRYCFSLALGHRQTRAGLLDPMAKLFWVRELVDRDVLYEGLTKTQEHPVNCLTGYCNKPIRRGVRFEYESMQIHSQQDLIIATQGALCRVKIANP
jgi:hypothetical protein